MKNHNDEAMASYFSSMLNETTSTQVIEKEIPEAIAVNVSSLPDNLVFSETETAIKGNDSEQKTEPTWNNIQVENEFQVLFFELSGLTFAVPLTDLGGIHYLDDSINSLIGKPP